MFYFIQNLMKPRLIFCVPMNAKLRQRKLQDFFATNLKQNKQYRLFWRNIPLQFN
jgi:hypothetical protein